MKLKEAAEYLGKTVNQLKDELTEALPQVNWKSDSDLPEDFVGRVEDHMKAQGKSVNTPKSTTNQLPKKEAENAIEAVGESAMVLDNLRYAILQTLADERTQQLVIETVYRAVDDVNTMETVYAETIEKLVAPRMSELKERRKAIDAKYSAHAKERNSFLGKLQGKLIAQSSELEESKTTSQNLSNAFLVAALGLR